jgi:hypothetical protein
MATRDGMDRASSGVRAAVGLVAAGVLGAVLACSSSSTPHPPMLSGCTEKDDVPCTGGAIGGGGVSSQRDGGNAEDAATGAVGDAAACTGATQIFGGSTTACVACIETSCCLNPTSCPNDTSCSSIALCILSCLPADPSCVQGCEAQASSATVAEFLDLASCSTINCHVCPTLQTVNGDI